MRKIIKTDTKIVKARAVSFSISSIPITVTVLLYTILFYTSFLLSISICKARVSFET